ncbi:MAG TPA: hypothetical protein P5248_10375, partial [Bacteroidales bacterium]|nr:hypothetical protein [Bacteroidales bacterium]
MEYLELKVFVPSTERERERLIGFLGMKGFDGFMEEEECLLAYREQGEDGMSPAEIQEEIRQTFGYSSATAVIPD